MTPADKLDSASDLAITDDNGRRVINLTAFVHDLPISMDELNRRPAALTEYAGHTSVVIDYGCFGSPVQVCRQEYLLFNGQRWIGLRWERADVDHYSDRTEETIVGPYILSSGYATALAEAFDIDPHAAQPAALHEVDQSQFLRMAPEELRRLSSQLSTSACR